jgi:protein-tyrosine-phosphatase
MFVCQSDLSDSLRIPRLFPIVGFQTTIERSRSPDDLPDLNSSSDSTRRYHGLAAQEINHNFRQFPKRIWLVDESVSKPSLPRMARVPVVILMTTIASNNQAGEPSLSQLIEPLRSYVAEATAPFDSIPDERRSVLRQAATFIAQRREKGEPAALTFICTHNSRRSHLSQVWAQTAACCYGLSNVRTFSGGTAATACDVRTVRALRRAGFSVVASTEGDNPVYLVQYSEGAAPLKSYSKLYRAKENPQKDYAAMMCCSDVDERCPIVFGAAARISLHYQDPKVADNTPEESAKYDERCRQIAVEMSYVMSLAAT